MERKHEYLVALHISKIKLGDMREKETANLGGFILRISFSYSSSMAGEKLELMSIEAEKARIKEGNSKFTSSGEADAQE